MPSYPVQLFSTLTTTSAAISLFGSSAIIFVVSQSTDKLKTTLNRLLFFLCIGDIMLSFPFLFTKAIVKFDDRLNADGKVLYSVPVATNQAACNAQGFFFVIGGILSPFYNCALCVYYLCVIKFNYSDTKIKKKIEPYLHAVPWTWASFCALYALASKSINANRTICWIEPAPIDCKKTAAGVDCERGKDAVELRMIFETGPRVAVFFAIFGMMTILYLTVWKQERRMRRYDHRTSSSFAGRRGDASMIAGRHPPVEANEPRGLLRQNMTNSRKVLNQALAYVGAYLLSYTLPITNQFIFIGSAKYNLSILGLSSVFYPLQGFFNFLVFIYPRVTRQLRGNEDMNVLRALLAAVQCKPIPPLRRNSSVGGSSAGGRGAKTRSRNISGLSGTPSSYSSAGCRSSGAANRPVQRATTPSTALACSLDSSPDCLDTSPDLKKKVSFADESITEGSSSRICNSRLLPGSIRRKSTSTTRTSCSSIAEETEVDKDVESCLQEESNGLGSEQTDGTDDNDTTTNDKRIGQHQNF